MSRTRQHKTFTDAEGKPHKYSLKQFGAEEGFDLLMDVLEAIGQPVGQLGTTVMLADTLSAFSGQSFGTAIEALAVKIRAAGGVAMLKRILKLVVRDAKKFSDAAIGSEKQWTFNEAYQGNYGEMFLVIAWVLEVNYRSFFDGALTRLREQFRTMMAELDESESEVSAAPNGQQTGTTSGGPSIAAGQLEGTR